MGNFAVKRFRESSRNTCSPIEDLLDWPCWCDPHEGHRLKYERRIELCFKLQGRPYWFLIYSPNEVTVMSLCWHKIKLKVSIEAEIIPRGLPRLCFTILNKFLTLILCPVVDLYLQNVDTQFRSQWSHNSFSFILLFFSKPDNPHGRTGLCAKCRLEDN